MPGVGQNEYSRACFSHCQQSFPCHNMLPSRRHRGSFTSILSVILCCPWFSTALYFANAVTHLGLRNKTGHSICTLSQPADASFAVECQQNINRLQSMPDRVIVTVNQTCVCDFKDFFSPPLSPHSTHCLGVHTHTHTHTPVSYTHLTLPTRSTV